MSSHQGVRVFGNTLGFLGGYASTLHSLSCVVIAQGNGEMQRDYWYSSVRDSSEMEAVTAIGKQAAARALRRLNARKLVDGDCARAVRAGTGARLDRPFPRALCVAAVSIAARRSCLDAAGQQVFPQWMQISERPHIPKALGSAPFDSEGVATRDRELDPRRRADRLHPGHVLGSQARAEDDR